MRLDLFLKASRVVLRRSVARQLCDAGAIRVNGLSAKASKELKAGDEIQIRRGNRLTVYRVLAIPATKQVSRAGASSLIELISDVKEQETLLP
jgi:ribosomal 50S subunit-recycling heat shock protein